MAMGVFSFDHAHAQPPMELRSLLGGKGANLAEMTSVLQLPVPPGFTVSTDVSRSYLASGWPAALDDAISTHLTDLEAKMGRRLGAADDPLLVSVRSGAEVSMPGMLDTVLNLGLNDRSVDGLAAATGDERFAYDSYRRFIQMFSQVVKGLASDAFDEKFARALELADVEAAGDVPADLLKYVCGRFLAIYEDEVGEPFPPDPGAQLRMAIEAVFSSWNGARAIAYRNREGISHGLGTAVNIQAMVFGNKGAGSGTGVGFTRNPSTGQRNPYGDFLANAQGEDVVAGTHSTEDIDIVGSRFPAVYEELTGVFERLEAHYRDMCDVEFTIEEGKLWILQTRVGKRTGVAALRMAKEMTTEPGIALTRAEAVNRITVDHLEQVLHSSFEETARTLLTTGLAASPGAAVGKVVLSAEKAVIAKEAGEAVILVRQETSPEDVHGMAAAVGILTSRGGLVSHAAIVARGWGTPAVCGADAIELHDDHFTVGGQRVDEGDVISLDGSSGEVILGALGLVGVEPPPEFDEILEWADGIRDGKMEVRANADTGDDAKVGRDFGAEGIGLCRTERMFLGEDRLPIVRQMILANSPAKEEVALSRLRMAQREDFVDILAAMDGLPVTVRLLDAPLHEFLPDVEHLAAKEARSGLTPDEADLLSAARDWQEQNPMTGTRGVRLGYLKPGLYAMQVTALLEAVAERVAEGGTPIVEVMIPLTVTAPELAGARRWVTDVLEAEGAAGAEVTVGTMIETPRAALRADEIAEHADFVCFGTDDPTQLTFDSLDATGVGELVRIGAVRGRKTKPGLKLGVCGEHGGDLASIKVFYEAGIDYVSCSPSRVPVARLAAAQGVIAAEELA